MFGLFVLIAYQNSGYSLSNLSLYKSISDAILTIRGYWGLMPFPKVLVEKET